MAIPMPIVQDIRRLDRQGLSRAQIARRLHVDRGTVAKYADMEDCSPKPKADRRYGSKIDPYAHLVDGGWRPIVCCPGSSGTRSGACTTVCWRRRTTTASIRPRCVTCTGGARRTAACRIARGTCGSSGRRAACRSISAWPGPDRWRDGGRALPGGLVAVFEHAVVRGVAGRERGVSVPWPDARVRAISGVFLP